MITIARKTGKLTPPRGKLNVRCVCKCALVCTSRDPCTTEMHREPCLHFRLRRYGWTKPAVLDDTSVLLLKFPRFLSPVVQLFQTPFPRTGYNPVRVRLLSQSLSKNLIPRHTGWHQDYNNRLYFYNALSRYMSPCSAQLRYMSPCSAQFMSPCSVCTSY